MACHFLLFCGISKYFSGSVERSDPLGRVIALIFLTIILLSILTLSLRVCSNLCLNNGNGKKCCAVQMAISVQCCCELKSGRLRIIPDGTEDNPEGHLPPPTAANSTDLYPPPPPSYIDIFPPNVDGGQGEGQGENQGVSPGLPVQIPRNHPVSNSETGNKSNTLFL